MVYHYTEEKQNWYLTMKILIDFWHDEWNLGRAYVWCGHGVEAEIGGGGGGGLG